MRQTLLLFLVILFSIITIGCSQKASDKLNGTWKQKYPGTETMVLDFKSKNATFIQNQTGEKNYASFMVSSELENEANIIFTLNGKSIYAKFILTNENGTDLITTINNEDYFYSKESSSTITGK